MRVDPFSFALGFGTATGVSAVAWLSRKQLAGLREATGQRLENTRQIFGQAADERYRRELAQHLRQRHLAAALFPLDAVLIEPTLVPAPPPALPPVEGEPEAPDVFRVVPVFHDLPYSYAPYNIETLALEDLSKGDRHVAILGVSGLGKSTALVTLALMALGEVRFETLEELTTQAIEEQETGLSEDERALRAREREEMRARAREKWQETLEQRRKLFVAGAQEKDAEEAAQSLALDALLPILVDMRDLEFDPALYGHKDGALDPAEPLVRAAQGQVSAVTAQMLGTLLYPALETGRALVLLDGYDALSAEARETYFPWLEQFLALYGHNRVVISGPATGYAHLTALGFTPTFLRAWREDEYARLVQRWAEAWHAHSGERPDPDVIHRLTVGNRARPMVDVTLKIWAGLADDMRIAGRAGWYDALLHRLLPEVEDFAPLAEFAARLTETGAPLPRADLLAELDDAAATAFDAANKAGVLVGFADERYDFAHAQLTAYLAGQALIAAGPERAAEVALEPRWQDALSFAAAELDLMPAVQRRMESTPDLLYSTLFGLTRWAPDAPPEAPWRGELFRRLGAAMMAPQQFPTVRERAMAAMIAAREPNVLFVFRQALRSVDADTRRLGCIGLGALGNEDAVDDLAAMMADREPRVQLAAGLALGAIGSEKAIELMIQALLQGSNDLRRAIAEALAALPGEGHQTLREAAQAEEIEIRRAAVFGLSRVRQPWAVSTLYRMMFEDSQWYVRSAAEDAFLVAQSPEHEGPRAYPEADTLSWLVQWAGERGQGVPAGEAARQVLARALQEAEPPYKVLAALTLGQLGHLPALKALYAALRDRHPEVRSAAYAALAELQTRLGRPLPGLV